MLKRLLLFLILFICNLNVFSQNSRIDGFVADELNGYAIQNATVTIMRTSDSLLVNYSRTKTDGSFSIKSLIPGHYDLFISYPDYLGYATDIELEPGKDFLLDTVYLIKNSQLLKEITIVDGSKIKFKGDTIQFLADSFRVGENANVEDLLKKLSGIKVNSKGEITAFGEKVEKVFVDGEEFFGSDPTIATRNIQAKAVDKVQVFDKTSTMEELTGIADGEKFKAINLTLKEEYKKGYFGKASAGVGLDPVYYDGSLMLQGYTAKSKISAYGIGSNTGTVSLDFNDYGKYMNSSAGSVSFDGNMTTISFSSEDDFSWDGRYDGEGLPKSLAGGASFSTKLAKDKIRINANYGYSDIQLKKNEKNISTNYLPDDGFVKDDSQFTDSRIIKHSALFKVEADLDSLTTLIWNNGASTRKTNNYKEVHTRQNDLEQNPITEINRTLTNKNTGNSINSELTLTRKFKKKHRLLVINGSGNYSENEGSSYLNSRNDYFTLNQFQQINQLVDKGETNFSYQAKATYSEPLGKKWTGQINVYTSNVANHSNKLANEFDEITQQYSKFVDSLSNDFDYRINSNGGGASINYKGEKYDFRFGTDVDYSNTIRKNKIDSSSIIDNALRWIPRANFTYKFNRASRISMNYYGSTRQPSINQIQPVRDNSDPTVLIKGNPALKQSYTQSISMYYNFWKALSDVGLWSYANFSNTFNEIVSNTIIDEARRSITTFTNVNGGYNGNVGFNYNMPLGKNFESGFGLGAGVYNKVSFLDGARTAVLTTSISPSINLSYEREELFEINIDFSPSFSNSNGGLVANAGKYYSQTIGSNFKYKISKSIELTSDINWLYQGAQSSFSQQFSQVLWNANALWTVDKAKNFIVQLSVRDILNQNKGYERNVSSFSTSERQYDTIQRYGLLSLIYNIKSKSKVKGQ